MPPGKRLLPVRMQAPHKEGADGSLHQARRIDRHTSLPTASALRTSQPIDRLADRAVDGYVVQALQEAIQGGEVGYAHEPQGLAHFAVLA